MNYVRVFDGSDWVLSATRYAEEALYASSASWAEYAGVADTALADASGNNIQTYYAKKTEIPTVPANVSAFTNDAGYITMNDLTNANGVSF